jgi:diguanylate cyclase (GGDEF)-like protein
MRVLVADDEPVGRKMLGDWLTNWGFEPIAVADGAEALAVLGTHSEIRLAVLDWEMPVLDGLTVCRLLRSRPPEPYVYTLLLTARENKDDVIRGLDAGADDYLVKPCNPLELRMRLRTGRRIVELQEELVRAREALRVEAMHDALTGLMNRRAVLLRLGQELARAERSNEALAAIMVDIDHFKAINDRYGHGVGDQVLRQVASRLQRALRGYDAVGRLGGEEFVLLVPDCDVARGFSVAHRVVQAIRGEPFITSAGAVSVTVSAGLASSRQSLDRPGELVRAADSALYRAKRAGRDRVEVARRSDWDSSDSEVHSLGARD